MRDNHHFQTDFFDYQAQPKKPKYDTYKKNSSGQVDLSTLSWPQKEALGKQLAAQPVDSKTIFGYMSEHRFKGQERFVFCKYNKETMLFIMYAYIDDNLEFIKLQSKDWREYTGDKALEYYDEIN